jgi:hypothetical protein
MQAKLTENVLEEAAALYGSASKERDLSVLPELRQYFLGKMFMAVEMFAVLTEQTFDTAEVLLAKRSEKQEKAI